MFRDFNTPDENLTGDLTLSDAIRLYNEMDSEDKRLSVTKDKIATVDFVIAMNGKPEFANDYTHLVSFSNEAVIAEAVKTLKNEITEQGMTMGGMQPG